MPLVIVSHVTYVTAKSLNRIEIFVAWFKIWTGRSKINRRQFFCQSSKNTTTVDCCVKTRIDPQKIFPWQLKREFRIGQKKIPPSKCGSITSQRDSLTRYLMGKKWLRHYKNSLGCKIDAATEARLKIQALKFRTVQQILFSWSIWPISK